MDGDVLLALFVHPVVHELRVAHQMDNVLLQVLWVVQTQMLGGDAVEPFDASRFIQQHHANGQGLNGAQKGSEFFFCLCGFAFELAPHGQGGIAIFLPRWQGAWRLRKISFLQPAQHAHTQHGIQRHPGRDTE